MTDTRRSITAAVLLAGIYLAGCTSVTVRAPELDLPPIPPKLLVRCDEPIMPAGPTFADVATNAVENAVGPWHRCVAKDDALIAVVVYREQIIERWKAKAAKPEKPWWKFWGE